MLRLPDTGQTQSFTNTTGEDSDYLQNPPFFIVNGDGTVTDTITGLMWQQNDGGEMTIESAEAYCQNLILGGYSDWRLPTAQEAFSMFNHGKQNPPFDLAIFTNSGAEYWWTAERQVGNASKVWATNAGGGIGNHPKTETISAGGSKKFHARAVRDRQQAPSLAVQFSATFATAYDSLTGLEWQRVVNPIIQDSMTWEEALIFAENFVLAGKSDWRLPNIKELQSINDETRNQPSVNTFFFPGLPAERYWASTSLPNQPAQAWFLDTQFGVVSHELKTAKNYLICVRGGSDISVSMADLVIESQNKLHVFPNPFTTQFWVANSNQAVTETLPSPFVYQLFDGYGKLVFAGENISETNFSWLRPGIYILTTFGNNVSAVRLIKK